MEMCYNHIMKQVILTGDRPTGKLHIGHYVGSLQNRVELQNSGKYDMYIMVADMQALTDNAKNPAKIRENILEVALDYLAIGLDPAKSTLFIQSQIPALSELTMYYMNLVSLARVLRNPTVKTEISQKNWSLETMADQFIDANASFISKISKLDFKKREGVPAGFAMYPISQAADITAFGANLVPVGEDQLPMIEQAREIVRTFNSTYGPNTEANNNVNEYNKLMKKTGKSGIDTTGKILTMGGPLVEPEALIPTNEEAKRLPGIDGNAKMSKSLNNGIYLSDPADVLRQKVMSMYTDPHHIHVDTPGRIAGNTVFTYLDVFAPDDPKVAEMKEHYQRGGLGDVVVKKYLVEVLENILAPIRERREELAKDPAAVYEILKQGSEKANVVANETLQKVRGAIGVNYFN